MNTIAHAHPSRVGSTTDIDAAEAFYQALLVWNIGHPDTPTDEHLLASVGGHDEAGGNSLPDSAEGPSRWFDAFDVDDLDAAVERVQDAGGEVRDAPFEHPDGVCASIVRDASGAVFGRAAATEDTGDMPDAMFEKDGSVIMSATPTPMGPFAIIADPAGAVFQVMEYNGADER